MADVYFEGAFIPETEARLPISDRGIHAGDGAYATVQVKEGIPLFLETHLEHLREHCRSINLVMPPMSRPVIEELIQRNRAEAGIWRLRVLVTGGDAPENRLPQRTGRIMAFMHPFTPLPFKPLHLGVFPIPYSSCHAAFKSLSHLNRYYVMEDAYQKGVDDCVTVTEKGYVLEASFGNLIWIKEKTVFTPDFALPISPGITLKNTLQMARKLGFGVEYVKWRLNEIPSECVAFRTNSMQSIRPIAQIDDRAFPHHPTLQSLFVEGYASLIRAEQAKFTNEKSPSGMA